MGGVIVGLLFGIAFWVGGIAVICGWQPSADVVAFVAFFGAASGGFAYADFSLREIAPR